MDRFATSALIVIMMVLAVNQVVIKLTNDGLQPAFAVALSSAGAMLVISAWIRLRGQRLEVCAGTVWPGVAVGLIFSVEFLALFVALDLTTVTRVSVIFYSMPVWMALTAHFVLPGEHLTRVRSLGLALAFGGVAWAIVAQSALGIVLINRRG